MKNSILDTIKKTRIYNKIEQKEMAKKLNLTSASYNLKENGKQQIRLSEVLQILEILNIKMILDNKIINNTDEATLMIKNKREEKGYTQDYMFIKIGLRCKQSYCNKENGKATFYLEECLNVCNALNINISLNIPLMEVKEYTNVKNKKVQCVNTGKIYNSIKEAAEKTGASNSLITKCCKGQRASAGKINGEKGIWKYV